MLIFVGSVVVTVALFALAGMFVLMIDIEENTRSSFRLQQQMLEVLEQEPPPEPAEPAAAPLAPPTPARRSGERA